MEPNAEGPFLGKHENRPHPMLLAVPMLLASCFLLLIFRYDFTIFFIA
jgi:hypothetical protein